MEKITFYVGLILGAGMGISTILTFTYLAKDSVEQELYETARVDKNICLVSLATDGCPRSLSEIICNDLGYYAYETFYQAELKCRSIVDEL